jgi:GTP-binding protein
LKASKVDVTNRETRVSKPKVVIVGRPNVGKSTLFNRIIGWQKAIVEDTPGVTRDRNYADASWCGIEFTIVDTGGFEPETEDLYLTLMKEQVKTAIREADLILFLLDAKCGLMPQDKDVLALLRKYERPLLVVVNKIDHAKHEIQALEFNALGVDEIITVSADHGRKIDELLDAVIEKLPVDRVKNIVSEKEDGVKVAVIGKPNVGKSTLINRMLGEERLLTSPLPGTTRDSIDTPFVRDGKNYILIDTAGIRKRSKVTQSVERYSVIRAVRAIERSDVLLHMIDSQEGPAHQDAHISDLIMTKGRGCVILLNKWDLVPREVAEKADIEMVVKQKLKATDFAPVTTISAITGKNVNKILSFVDMVYENLNQKISTKRLNNFLQDLILNYPPPLFRGRSIKFYYISQPMTNPPTFVLFTNSVKGIPENYIRFFENKLRDTFNFQGTPLKFIFREERNKLRRSRKKTN